MNISFSSARIPGQDTLHFRAIGNGAEDNMTTSLSLSTKLWHLSILLHRTIHDVVDQAFAPETVLRAKARTYVLRARI